MIESSYFGRFLIFLYSAYEQSWLLRILNAVEGFFANAFRGCALARFLKHPSVEIYTSTSFFYNLLKRIWKAFLSFCGSLYNDAKYSFTGKIIYKLFNTSVIFKIENLLPVCVFIILVCPHEFWNNLYGLAMAIFLSMFYLIALLHGKKLGKRTDNIWLPFILFAFATFLALCTSSFISDSLRVFLFFITAFIFCMLTYGVLTDRHRFDIFGTWIFAGVVITGVVAIIQKRLGIEVDPLLTDTTLNASMPGRAFSTFANPNNYAQILVMLFPFCIAYALTRKKPLQKIVLIFMLIIPLAGLILTYSRSGWIGFAVTIIVFAVLINKKLLLPLIALGVLAVPFLPKSVIARILTIGNMADTSSAYRLYIWDGAFKLIKYFWYRGTGLGPAAFAEVYPFFAHSVARRAPHTHMLFLEVFAEMGFIGFMTFIYLICALVVRSAKNVLKEKNGDMRIYSVAAASSMLGILIIGFAEYVWFYPRNLFIFFIAIGVAMAAARKKDGNI